MTNINFIISYCTKEKEKKGREKKEKNNVITWQIMKIVKNKIAAV